MRHLIIYGAVQARTSSLDQLRQPTSVCVSVRVSVCVSVCVCVGVCDCVIVWNLQP